MGDDGFESIVLLGGLGGVDDDGYPLPGTADKTVEGCTVQLNVTGDDVARDRDGTVTELRVFAPPGTVIDEKRLVEIRGKTWRVDGIAFDWSINRRALLARHRPRVEFVVKRGEG
ncbi:hypothetical protein ACWIDS_16190 [Dietzia maris]